MFCKHCGKKIRENNKWCPYCGANLLSEQRKTDKKTVIQKKDEVEKKEEVSDIVVGFKKREKDSGKIEVKYQKKDSESTCTGSKDFEWNSPKGRPSNNFKLLKGLLPIIVICLILGSIIEDTGSSETIGILEKLLSFTSVEHTDYSILDDYKFYYNDDWNLHYNAEVGGVRISSDEVFDCFAEIFGTDSFGNDGSLFYDFAENSIRVYMDYETKNENISIVEYYRDSKEYVVNTGKGKYSASPEFEDALNTGGFPTITTNAIDSFKNDLEKHGLSMEDVASLSYSSINGNLNKVHVAITWKDARTQETEKPEKEVSKTTKGGAETEKPKKKKIDIVRERFETEKTDLMPSQTEQVEKKASRYYFDELNKATLYEGSMVEIAGMYQVYLPIDWIPAKLSEEDLENSVSFRMYSPEYTKMIIGGSKDTQEDWEALHLLGYIINGEVDAYVNEIPIIYNKDKEQDSATIYFQIDNKTLGYLTVSSVSSEEIRKVFGVAVRSLSKTENVTKRAEAHSIIQLGEAVLTDDFRIAFLSAQECEPGSYSNQFKAGYELWKFEFVIKNVSNEDQFVSDLVRWECYVDDIVAEQIWPDGVESLGETISSGRAVQETIYFEVPEHAESIELEYLISLWEEERIIFKAR